MGAAEAGGCRGWAALVSALAICCLLAVPSVVRAEEMTVNSKGDATTAEPNVGCTSPAETCTLRAAIEEANAAEEGQIEFDETVFAGRPGDLIALGSGLPVITHHLVVNGHDCETAAGVTGPCVDIQGPPGGVAIKLEGAENVAIEGIDVSGSRVGIEARNSAGLEVKRSWFGIGLDGSADGGEVGLLVGPGSDESHVGGEGPGVGNVFANETKVGLELAGASRVKVQGNSLGVGPDGSTTAANGTDVIVASEGSVKATGNRIGTRVSPTAAATPACDRGCNVISGAGSTGLDLAGEHSGQDPAVATTVVGNYIGLNAAGDAVVPNGSVGVEVGAAPETTVGGPRDTEANRFAGGEAGVAAGSAPYLVVQGNRIGTDAGVAGPSAAASEAGIAIDSGAISSAPEASAVISNRIGMDGGVGIAESGFGATITRNEISGADTGIRVDGFTERGSQIEGNSIEAAGANGILVESSFNVVIGNQVSGSGGDGIQVLGSLPFSATENLIGGDVPAAENVISDSGGDAIAITDLTGTNNEVARNYGSGNHGLFIDLLPAVAGGKPNGGVAPPAFAIASQTSATGTAEPGAFLRLFRKQGADPGELESFLGAAIADEKGKWEISYAALPPGTIVAATQTGAAGNTSELAVASTPAAPSSQPAPAKAAPSPPATRIVKGPPKRSHRRKVRFRFASDQAGSSFQCKLDGGRFKTCGSPQVYRGLKPGRHLFEVRAVDSAGLADPTPAKQHFRLLARR